MAILGVGLIGGSLGMALRAAGGWRAVGWDADDHVLTQAVDLGAIDAAVDSAEAACAGASIVVIAAPVPAIANLLAHIAPVIRDDTVVTDTGSTKERIVEAGESSIGSHFVGGHPMAGTEKSGISSATGSLFCGATWVLTPSTDTAPEAQSTVESMVRTVGARCVICTPQEHDTWVAAISHLPHIAAYALAAAAEETAYAGGAQLVAGSFRDGTRVALSDPQLWAGILLDNREAVLRILDRYSQQLAEVRDALAKSDRAALFSFLDKAHRARRRFPV